MAFWNRKKKNVPGQPAAEEHFSEKVSRFWEWYSDRANHLFEEIEAGRCGELHPEVSAKVNELWPTFAWVFGPPPEGKTGHSFTLSGEGILARQFLTEEWLRRAPDLDNWTFYASRQPDEFRPGLTIEINGHSFDFGGFWISPQLDEDREMVDITAWHPEFEKADERTSSTVLFLMLDEILGEYGVDTWLGVIETSDKKLAEAMPGGELREYLHNLEVTRGWKKYPPPETYSVYELPELTDEYLRGDTICGTTCNMKLVGAYLKNHGPVEDPVEGSGAEFLFVALDSRVLPEGEEVNFRGELEDAISKALEKENAGLVTGGATGRQFSYIDFINFKGRDGLKLVHRVLEMKKIPDSSAIHRFTE